MKEPTIEVSLSTLRRIRPALFWGAKYAKLAGSESTATEIAEALHEVDELLKTIQSPATEEAR